MATPREFETACPTCGPGIYAMEDGSRLRVGLTSDLSRFVRRQRGPVRIRDVLRLEPGRAPHVWRALLGALQAQGHVPRECQFEGGAARDVAANMARVGHHGSRLTAQDIRDRARRVRHSSSDSVASTRLESGSRPPPGHGTQHSIPPMFQKVLDEIGADD